MVAARPQVPKFTRCPSCSAQLRVNADLPDGMSVRCSGCQTSFRYRAPVVPKPDRRVLTCPGCALRFPAVISDENKIACPGCRARITIRQPRKTRLQTADGQKAAVSSPLKHTRLDVNRPSKKTMLGAEPAPAEKGDSRKSKSRTTVLKAAPAAAKSPANNRGWLGSAPATPPSARPGPGQDQASSASLVVALVLLLVAGGYPLWSMCFGGAKRQAVAGVVTFEGKPIVVGSVVLQGEDDVPLTALIKPDGSYAISGVPHGKVRIAVHVFDQASLGSEPNASVGGQTEENQEGMGLPERYGSVNRSGLSVMVNSDTTYNIELVK